MCSLTPVPCLKGGKDRAENGSTAWRERGSMTLGMTSFYRVVNTRKLLMFRNREPVVNVFSVKLTVNLNCRLMYDQRWR